MTIPVDVAVIGAGLSGLAVAHGLRGAGRDVIVLEARDRVGGRVHSVNGYDLGPAWIWPHNHRMLDLVAQLGLQTFPQHSAGRLVFEDPNGRVRRDLSMATMGNALRVAGGLARVTDALADGLGDAVRLGHVVQKLDEDGNGVTLTATGKDTIRADRVVLAIPPRLAAGLGVQVTDVPTWMAGHAKLIAIYDAPFWRTAGLNGDAVSHRGPLAEIHDASAPVAGEGALFGFAVPGAARRPDFEAAALAQLARLFGPKAGSPLRVLIKDWSADPATATDADLNVPTTHPKYPAIPSTARLIFAGTEAAPVEGGFLEGALEAAEAALQKLEGLPA